MNVNRIIGEVEGSFAGGTTVFIAGLHGNEPAGVKALKTLMDELSNEKEIYGKIICLTGNLGALKKNQRYLDEDLNRIWTKNHFESLKEGDRTTAEKWEMAELYPILTTILETARRPLYFIDFHTVSVESEPFIVLNDSLVNRSFVSHYPLRKVLGIEEHLQGTLLSYLNELGYVSFGFEAGQHESKESYRNSLNFARYTLGLTGNLSYKVDVVENIKTSLATTSQGPSFYEIYYQYLLNSSDRFKMTEGFTNFEFVPENVTIAVNGSTPIRTMEPRLLFMPLYQEKGNVGFFYIKKVSNIFLWLSKSLRITGLNKLLLRFPGVSKINSEREKFKINKKVAVFLAQDILHLLGYRIVEDAPKFIIVQNREHKSKLKEYKNTVWYK